MSQKHQPLANTSISRLKESMLSNTITNEYNMYASAPLSSVGMLKSHEKNLSKISRCHEFIPFLNERDHLGRLIKKGSSIDKSRNPEMNLEHQFTESNSKNNSSNFRFLPTSRSQKTEENQNVNTRNRQSPEKQHFEQDSLQQRGSLNKDKQNLKLIKFSLKRQNVQDQIRVVDNALRKKISLNDYKSTLSPKKQNHYFKVQNRQQDLGTMSRTQNSQGLQPGSSLFKSLELAPQTSSLKPIELKRNISLNIVQEPLGLKKKSQSMVSFNSTLSQSNTSLNNKKQFSSTDLKASSMRSKSLIRLTDKYQKTETKRPNFLPQPKDIDIELNSIKVNYLECSELERYEKMKNLKMKMKPGFEKNHETFMDRFQRSKDIIMNIKRTLQE